jgi:hypothetical protein
VACKNLLSSFTTTQALTVGSQAASIMNMPRQRIPQWTTAKQMRGIITYFFLSQSAILFVRDAQRKITRAERMMTYVRIIRDVDAARIARFPANFTPNVGDIRRRSTEGAYGIEYVQRLMCRLLVLWVCRSESNAHLTVNGGLQCKGDDSIRHSVTGIAEKY